jgi:hypothetical protein
VHGPEETNNGQRSLSSFKRTGRNSRFKLKDGKAIVATSKKSGNRKRAAREDDEDDDGNEDDDDDDDEAENYTPGEAPRRKRKVIGFAQCVKRRSKKYDCEDFSRIPDFDRPPSAKTEPDI